jgi:Big-like domain-containing protein/lysyl oxidase
MKRNLFFAALQIFAVPILCVAQTVVYPDLQVITPPMEISIGHPTPSTREFRFSHITWNAGAGPLEIRPYYNSSTGMAQASQRLYSRNSSGQLAPVQDVLIAVPMKFDQPSDYRFALSSFGLYSDSNGSIGALMAPSPKIDFCITEDFLVSGASVPGIGTVNNVPNTPPSVVYNGSNCNNPSGILGLSVGWGDKYDYTDPGENIDITNLPDGVYWLRSIADPYHLLQESNRSNNITDTQLRISGDTVTILQQTHPDSTPPTVTLTSPANGSSVSGAVTLTATVGTSPAVGSVQFLVDGQPIGGQVTSTTTTYSTTWDTAGASGPHLLTAQATASGSGFVGTAPPVSVTVPTQVGSLVLDQTLSVDNSGTTTTTPAFSTSTANELLLAFVAADGPSTSQAQSVTVSGAGLNWTLVSRANTQFGTAEIWAATGASALTNVTVSSTENKTGYDQSLNLLMLHGSSGVASVGAHGSASALQGTPAVSVTTTGNGSWVLGVGNDWDQAVARTLGSNQQLLHQWVDTRTGDTFWV